MRCRCRLPHRGWWCGLERCRARWGSDPRRAPGCSRRWAAGVYRYRGLAVQAPARRPVPVPVFRGHRSACCRCPAWPGCPVPCRTAGPGRFRGRAPPYPEVRQGCSRPRRPVLAPRRGGPGSRRCRAPVAWRRGERAPGPGRRPGPPAQGGAPVAGPFGRRSGVDVDAASGVCGAAGAVFPGGCVPVGTVAPLPAGAAGVRGAAPAGSVACGRAPAPSVVPGCAVACGPVACAPAPR